MSDERETKDNRNCIAFDCCGASFVFRISGKIIRHTLGDVLYDNRSHCIFCEKLPSIAEVKKVVQPIDEIFKAKMKPCTTKRHPSKMPQAGQPYFGKLTQFIRNEIGRIASFYAIIIE